MADREVGVVRVALDVDEFGLGEHIQDELDAPCVRRVFDNQRLQHLRPDQGESWGHCLIAASYRYASVPG